MATDTPGSVDVLIVAVRETAGSALYGMVDVLCAAGHLWQALTGETQAGAGFRVGIVSLDGKPFSCGNGIPVTPDFALDQCPTGQVIILPELWLAPEESFRGRYPELMVWLRACYASGAALYSACSGSIMLAETGLLNGCAATSHWGYEDLFEREYPEVEFRPEPNLVVADGEGRIVTAGGTTSWHDLALHIIARHISPGEALRIAKVYLLKWHGEGQLPFAPLIRHSGHADAVVRNTEEWLKVNFADDSVISQAVARSGVAERTFKRRFKKATGSTLKDYVQNLRIEWARGLLESTCEPVEEISAAVGYEDVSFFRRLFKRCTGLTPARYRRLFQPVRSAGTAIARSHSMQSDAVTGGVARSSL